MSNEVQIPEFKLAKVGVKRERKKGGIPLWFLGRGASRFSGAYGGGALGGVLGGLGAKIGVSILAAALGAGAYGLGKTLAPNEAKLAAAKQSKLFADGAPRYGGDLSGLPSNGRAPDSLGMVSGSLDGKTPEQRAAEAAEAQAAANAGAQVQADQDDAAQQAPAAAGVPDPASLAAAAGAGASAGKSGPFASRFGNLSSALSGQSGASALAGGAGLSGGIGRSFDSLAKSPGKITGIGAPRAPSRASARQARPTTSHGRGLARRQLDRAVDLSNQARTGVNETRATRADTPFTNNPGAGSAIGGVGSGTGGVLGPGADEVAVNQPNTGGPIDASNASVTPDCNAQFPDGGYLTPTGGCAPKVKGKNVTPWQGLSKMAMILLIIGNALLLAAYLMSLTGYGKEFAYMFAYAAAAVGAIVSVLGMVIMGMGQTLQGLIYTLSGAGLAVGGLWAASGMKPTPEWNSGAISLSDQIRSNMMSEKIYSAPSTTTPDAIPAKTLVNIDVG